MEAASNLGIVPLADMLFAEMLEGVFGTYCLTCTARCAKHLSDFMDREDMHVYDEATDSAFWEEFCQTHHRTTPQRVKRFIARLNSIFKKEGFVSRQKLVEPTELPENLDKLLFVYKEHCSEKGNCAAAIQRNEHCCRSFLKLSADDGICDNATLAVGIDRNGRGVCIRVFRSSLASSMVNGGVPYKAA